MWLLAQALQRLIKRGPLTVIGPDGNVTTYGAPDPGLNPVTVRFTDAGVARQIASDPGLGAAEAWMDGRLLLEQGEFLRPCVYDHPSVETGKTASSGKAAG